MCNGWEVRTKKYDRQKNAHLFVHTNFYNVLLNFRWDVQNNTWAMAEALRPLVLNFEFKRNGKTAYITTGFPGFVGAFTGFIPVS